MPTRKEICVIGAGFSGMTAIIELKEEGHDPVCFEQTGNPGGTWCYRDEILENVASVMKSTVLNHSKEIGAYSNHPPPTESNNYMKQWELYKYLMDHWNEKDCMRHVRFNTEVVRLRQADDYDVSGRWSVTVKHKVTGEVRTHVFDGVMVCVGHMSRPKLASYPGQELFEGKIMHTHSLKRVEEFEGQNVLVVGTGCSALDAAVEISNVANKVYMSTRSGTFILNRVGWFGIPMDTILYRRCFSFLLDYVSFKLLSPIVEKVFMNQVFHKNNYPVPPKYPALSKDPIVNDFIFPKLLSGSVMQKRDVDHFTEKGIVFDGEHDVTKVDSVIMATGYTWKFSFLDNNVMRKDDDIIHLYKCMYPTHLKHSTLCFVGFFLPFGPGFPGAELQSRWAARVFNGKSSLPDEQTMVKDVTRRHEENIKRYIPNERMSIKVDYIPYLDTIASEFGVKPDLVKLFFTDIRLFLAVVFGPHLPYQYRLNGPHKWDGARNAILTCNKRIAGPMRNKGYFVGYIMLFIYLLFKLIF